MSRITVYLNSQNDSDLEKYMKENHIKRKSIVIKIAIEEFLKDKNVKQKLLQKKSLYKINLYGKLLEQHFVNMGFSFNEKIDMDNNLKQFYEKNNRYGGDIDWYARNDFYYRW